MLELDNIRDVLSPNLFNAISATVMEIGIKGNVAKNDVGLFFTCSVIVFLACLIVSCILGMPVFTVDNLNYLTPRS